MAEGFTEKIANQTKISYDYFKDRIHMDILKQNGS